MRPTRAKKSHQQGASSVANKKWEYIGEKKITTIRLSESEKKQIVKKYGSLQAFVQEAIKELVLR